MSGYRFVRVYVAIHNGSEILTVASDRRENIPNRENGKRSAPASLVQSIVQETTGLSIPLERCVPVTSVPASGEQLPEHSYYRIDVSGEAVTLAQNARFVSLGEIHEQRAKFAKRILAHIGKTGADSHLPNPVSARSSAA